jgi:hypothetical protein
MMWFTGLIRPVASFDVSVGEWLGNAISVFTQAMPGLHALIRLAGQGFPAFLEGLSRSLLCCRPVFLRLFCPAGLKCGRGRLVMRCGLLMSRCCRYVLFGSLFRGGKLVPGPGLLARRSGSGRSGLRAGCGLDCAHIE